MSGRHLLLVWIGPVQDFIAQARRTRDLWFGSHLLSELSRACAARLAADGAELIFPALKLTDHELAPCDQPVRSWGDPPLAIANKVLATAPDGLVPRRLAENARNSVIKRWQGISDSVRTGRGRSLLAPGIGEVWDDQVDDVLEFYAVWVPLDPDYEAARREAERVLAGRKNLRAFRQLKCDRKGAPKSSLDGARVSVLAANRTHPDFRRFRIGETEQLDAIGLVKRTGFEPEQFVPITNVAAGHWLAQANEQAAEELEALREACRDRIPRVVSKLPVVEAFGYDATVLYPWRWKPLFKEIGLTEDAAKWGEVAVTPLLRAMRHLGPPPSYVACLVADGDHMGNAIAELKSDKENFRFSERLAAFPQQARSIVQSHYGSLVYAGGDDVLAFVPVVEAVACADELRTAFHQALKGVVASGVTPTMSVGLGIGHTIEPMSGLLSLGREAERLAKNPDRNALAVIVDKRSGGQRRFRICWTQTKLGDPEPAVRRLDMDANLLHDNKLSSRKLYALDALRRRFPAAEQVAREPYAAAALRAYAEDLLEHVGDKAGRVTLGEIGVNADGSYASLQDKLAGAIDRLIALRTMLAKGL